MEDVGGSRKRGGLRIGRAWRSVHDGGRGGTGFCGMEGSIGEGVAYGDS